jgi:hypothetical protein
MISGTVADRSPKRNPQSAPSPNPSLPWRHRARRPKTKTPTPMCPTTPYPLVYFPLLACSLALPFPNGPAHPQRLSPALPHAAAAPLRVRAPCVSLLSALSACLLPLRCCRRRAPPSSRAAADGDELQEPLLHRIMRRRPSCCCGAVPTDAAAAATAAR